MQFERQKKQNFWTNYAVRLILEYVVIYLVLKIFQSSYDTSSQLGEALLGLIILSLLEIALALKNSLILYVLYRWKGKEEAVVDLLASFKKVGLPKPAEYYLDADGYIEDVLKDEEATQDAKNFVSLIFGVLTAYRANQMIVRGALYQSCLEEAIKRYQASFH
ncbi:hypothetical protein [Polynucleobacter difficilis]|uniref:hypothetical protein n=1 Tax=Polynucleobacter difficilis TaxID=556054 RepID=UPI000D3C44FD|nr:hypothetical protein [Polynucleobacter difficilis]